MLRRLTTMTASFSIGINHADPYLVLLTTLQMINSRMVSLFLVFLSFYLPPFTFVQVILKDVSALIEPINVILNAVTLSSPSSMFSTASLSDLFALCMHAYVCVTVYPTICMLVSGSDYFVVPIEYYQSRCPAIQPDQNRPTSCFDYLCKSFAVLTEIQSLTNLIE